MRKLDALPWWLCMHGRVNTLAWDLMLVFLLQLLRLRLTLILQPLRCRRAIRTSLGRVTTWRWADSHLFVQSRIRHQTLVLFLTVLSAIKLRGRARIRLLGLGVAVIIVVILLLPAQRQILEEASDARLAAVVVHVVITSVV